jgi:hypothetical protein
VKHWLCKPCHEKGVIKIMAVTSTWSAVRHLESNQHSIFPPGVIPPTAGAAMNSMNSYLEAQHPLQAERWRADFMSWITYDDITWEQAASPYLHKVILNGGAHVKHLLPCARTVRSWVMSTYHERIRDVKEALSKARSRINLSFDAWSSPNHLSVLGIVAH